jgi:hypothetical protein
VEAGELKFCMNMHNHECFKFKACFQILKYPKLQNLKTCLWRISGISQVCNMWKVNTRTTSASVFFQSFNYKTDVISKWIKFFIFGMYGNWKFVSIIFVPRMTFYTIKHVKNENKFPSFTRRHRHHWQKCMPHQQPRAWRLDSWNFGFWRLLGQLDAPRTRKISKFGILRLPP